METMILSDQPKLCYNNYCNKVIDIPRPGWKYIDGRVAELCDACFVAYRLGKYCNVYHVHVKYWRQCNSCKKSFHLGCIVSQGSYEPLKLGGLEFECLDCVTPQAISTRLELSTSTREDNTWYRWARSPVKAPNFHLQNTKIAASGPVVCNQTPFMLNSSKTTAGRLKTRGHVSSPPLGEKINEKLAIGSSKITAPQNISGFKNQASIHSPSPTTLASARPPLLVAKDQEKVSESGGEPQTPPAFGSKSSTETQARSQTPRKIKLQYRYTPRITDQELKQISRGLNVEVTPLFEKVLSKSDTGYFGRLVVPKKCAEVYFPSIKICESITLRIQDSEGKDWEMNFKFWSNNNSRMYVLERFNDYAQSMKLREGDTVMFSRLEPEGKLVMGYRKATTASRPRRRVKKGKITKNTSNNVSKGKTKWVTVSQDKPKDLTKASILSKRKSSEMGNVTESNGKKVSNTKTTSVSQAKPNDLASVHLDVLGPKARRAKRKRVEKGSPSKSTENEKKMKNLDLAFKGAQELIRPQLDGNPPSRMVVEGVKLKSYKDGPILGSPSMFTKLDPRNKQGSSKKIKNGNPELEHEVVVTPALPALPPKVTKKHPRHRPGCACIVCKQAPSGSKHKPSCECSICATARRRRGLNSGRGKRSKIVRGRPPSEQENIPTPPEVESLNLNQQMVVNGGSDQENPNVERSSGSGCKLLPFDLNCLPEPEDGSMDAVVAPVQEMPPDGDHI